MKRPMIQSFPKSRIMGTEELRSATNPATVTISATITGIATWLTVLIAALTGDSPFVNSSSILLWNWMA
ncbi:Uncharacterised protein [uncultured archaeon]|nr:Uncharacterised protein [uncultured archaeon]